MAHSKIFPSLRRYIYIMYMLVLLLGIDYVKSMTSFLIIIIIILANRKGTRAKE